MEEVLSFIQANLTWVPILGASIAFIWSAVVVVINWRKSKQSQDFEQYHVLIEKLVGYQLPEKGEIKEDCQIAIVYELRNFPRYYDVTYRILDHLDQQWEDSENHTQHVRYEIQLTKDYIKQHSPNLSLDVQS